LKKTLIAAGFILFFVIGFIIGAGCIQRDIGGDSAKALTPTVSGTASAYQTPVKSTSSCTPVTITQTDGSQVTLPCHAERIVVTNGNAAEMLIAIGAGDRVVGVTDWTKNVSYIMDKIPHAVSVGDWQIPNVERILSLHPDVVISYASSKPKNLNQFTAANITVIYLDCYRLSTLASDARSLGKLTLNMNEAEVYARMVEDTIAVVTKRVKTIPPDQYPTVYFESYMDFTAAARGSGSDEMLTLAGGKNIAGDIPTPSAKVSAEWVVARQPEYIMKVISQSNTKPFPAIVESLKSREGWNTIPAVKNNRVYVFANEIEYGPRAYVGLVWTAQLLYPGTFRDLHPRTMLIDYANRYVNGTNTTTVIYP